MRWQRPTSTSRQFDSAGSGPAMLLAQQGLPARRTSTRLKVTGPPGHALNLAVPSWPLRRDDQIGGAVFRPIDHLERRPMTTDRPVHRPIIDVLYVEDCPSYPDTLALVQRVGTELGIDVELRTTLIADQAAAEQARFPGSPTVRVDGHDVEPGSEPPAEYTVACRLYRHEHHFAGRPEERWVRDALLHAAGRT